MHCQETKTFSKDIRGQCDHAEGRYSNLELQSARGPRATKFVSRNFPRRAHVNCTVSLVTDAAGKRKFNTSPFTSALCSFGVTTFLSENVLCAWMSA
jgi:hypothetical protein